MRGRFRTLDAMRGFAALVVVLYHSTSLVSARCADGISCEVPFGYLAVDLFFALSGFVLAKAYDHRLEAGMGVARFMRIRMARLLPIFLVGLAIGAAPHIADALRGQGGGKHVAIEAALNAVLLPSPSWQHPSVLFALDPPAWSLFFELWVANLLFAIAHPWLRERGAYGLIGVALLALIWAQQHFGTLNVGSFWFDMVGGFPRVIFSFFLGAVLYRTRERFRVPRLPAWTILAVVVVTFWLPLGGAGAQIFELGAVLLIYPSAILLGATAIERRPAVGQMLGDWSYAVYAVHVPLLHLAIHEVAVRGVDRSIGVLAVYVAFVIVTAALIARLDQGLNSWRARLSRQGAQR